MIWRRILIEKRRKVHPTRAMVAFASVDGSNLWSDPAHHEVLEHSRHFFCDLVWLLPLSPLRNAREKGCFEIWLSRSRRFEKLDLNVNVNVNLNLYDF